MSSSKTLASAMLGYGADIKVKNIVLEMFFVALPIIYLNKRKIINPEDELVVDYFFSYVKDTLADRGELSEVAASLVISTFPEIKPNELKDEEIKILGDIAIKRVVYQALTKIKNRIYDPEPDPGSEKPFSLEQLIDTYFVLEPTSKLSVLDKSSGQVKNYTSQDVFPPPPVDGKQIEFTVSSFFQQKKGGPKVENLLYKFDYHSSRERKLFRNQQPQNNSSKFVEGVETLVASEDDYAIPRLCIEPYLKIKTRPGLDVRKSFKEKTKDNPAMFLFAKAIILNAYELYTSVGNLYLSQTEDDIKESLNKLFAAPNFDSFDITEPLLNMGSQEFVCSPEDFKAILSFKGGNKQIDYFNTIFESLSVGVRCSIDRSCSSEYFSIYPPKDDYFENLLITSPSTVEKGFADKSLFYKSPRLRKPAKQANPGGNVISVYLTNHFTYVVGSAEKEYKFSQYDKALKEIDGFTSVDLKSFFKQEGINATNQSANSLLIDLFKKPEIDALVKSLFTTNNIANLLLLAPHVEISKDVAAIMRKEGVFSGMDEGLNEMISTLKSYLSGDFPWSDDCEGFLDLL